jgi:hypothetical protein
MRTFDALRHWPHTRLAYLVFILPVLTHASDLSSVTKAPGELVTLEISVDSQRRAPVALEWEVVFPAQLMDMEGNGPQVGGAAKDSGKSLQCTARTPYALVCTVSGGRTPIADGLIAIYRFIIRPTAAKGITALRVEKAEATTADSTKWSLNNTEAIVVIR